MSSKLAKIEKRTAYLLILPSVLLVFSIILNNKCQFKSNLLKCELGNWPKKYRENLEIVFQNTNNQEISKKEIKEHFS